LTLPEFSSPPAMPWLLYVAGMAKLGLCPMAHPLAADGSCGVCPGPSSSASSGASSESSSPRKYSTKAALMTAAALR